MDEKSQEINKLNELRKRLTNLSDLIAVGKSTKDYLAKHPVGSITLMVLIGVFTAFVSGGIIRLVLKLISFVLKVAAFIIVAKETLDKVTGFFKKKK